MEKEEFLCPKCKNGYLRFPPKHAAFCSNDNCDFIIPRKIGGKIINNKVMRQLIEEGITCVLIGLRSKRGNLFNAHLKLDKNCETVFEFPSRKPKEKYRDKWEKEMEEMESLWNDDNPQ